MRSITGTESWYRVTKEELRAKFYALKKGALIINRAPFEEWRYIEAYICGKRLYIDYPM